MKKILARNLLAWLIGSFFGIFSLMEGSTDSLMRIGISLFFIYGLFYQIWIILIYWIVNLILIYFNFYDKNVFILVGIISVLFRLSFYNFQLEKYSTISSIVLILLGVCIWFKEKNRIK